MLANQKIFLEKYKVEFDKVEKIAIKHISTFSKVKDYTAEQLSIEYKDIVNKEIYKVVVFPSLYDEDYTGFNNTVSAMVAQCLNSLKEKIGLL